VHRPGVVIPRRVAGAGGVRRWESRRRRLRRQPRQGARGA